MIEPGPEKFGKFIERYRCGHRWSQNQLGKLIGVRSSYVTSVENGELWPDDHVIDQFAALFGVPHEHLYAMLGPKPLAVENRLKSSI
ncbi:helix-turn-helix domain-containing protein [Rhizobiales bacterium 3FA27D7]|uniref:helix-turn-helix domain-containing protein n=1 Tax=Mesorhizobium sp. 2RAF21 TaxID=3232995 RepID=UPI0010F66BBD